MLYDLIRSALHRMSGVRSINKFTLRSIKLIESFLYGGQLREKILVRLLGALYKSQYRRDWIFSDTPPHFYNQRWNAFRFIYGKKRSPYIFYRGFFISEIIRHGDKLLDIGCGDGFFSKSFFSEKCGLIEAFDIDPSAIDIARKQNHSDKINFYTADAVDRQFPSGFFDIIVWDGAIGHLDKESASTVLKKIAVSLSPEGIFTGSESLGTEGFDHRQFFVNESDLTALFKPYFKHIFIRVVEYEIEGGFLRKEAYWRCCNDLDRHQSASWIEYAKQEK